MVVPPTPKPTCKAEVLARAPPTIASSCEGNAALKKWHLPQCVFIITDKAKLVVEEVKGVGVLKDEEIKIEEIEASHTLGG